MKMTSDEQDKFMADLEADTRIDELRDQFSGPIEEMTKIGVELTLQMASHLPEHVKTSDDVDYLTFVRPLTEGLIAGIASRILDIVDPQWQSKALMSMLKNMVDKAGDPEPGSEEDYDKVIH